jgi:hypothetical protein
VEPTAKRVNKAKDTIPGFRIPFASRDVANNVKARLAAIRDVARQMDTPVASFTFLAKNWGNSHTISSAINNATAICNISMQACPRLISCAELATLRVGRVPGRRNP